MAARAREALDAAIAAAGTRPSGAPVLTRGRVDIAYGAMMEVRSILLLNTTVKFWAVKFARERVDIAYGTMMEVRFMISQ